MPGGDREVTIGGLLVSGLEASSLHQYRELSLATEFQLLWQGGKGTVNGSSKKNKNAKEDKPAEPAPNAYMPGSQWDPDDDDDEDEDDVPAKTVDPAATAASTDPGPPAPASAPAPTTAGPTPPPALAGKTPEPAPARALDPPEPSEEPKQLSQAKISAFTNSVEVKVDGPTPRRLSSDYAGLGPAKLQPTLLDYRLLHPCLPCSAC